MYSYYTLYRYQVHTCGKVDTFTLQKTVMQLLGKKAILPICLALPRRRSHNLAKGLLVRVFISFGVLCVVLGCVHVQMYHMCI